MSISSSLLSGCATTCQSRQRARKASAESKNANSPAPLLFETLEPRLLLAADPLGITAGYAFNEVSGTTTADASGHGIVGTLTNGPTFTAGKYGNAVALDGVNDFVNLGNPTALQFTGSMTVSAWVYATSFPADDAAVVSKRTAGEIGYQLDITTDTGPRTIGFKLTNSSGGAMFRYGATTLQPIPGTTSPASTTLPTQTLDVYLNGVTRQWPVVGTVTSSQQNSTANVNIGRRAGGLLVSSSPAASTMCASPITRSRKRRSRPTWQRRSAGPHRRRPIRRCRTFRSRRRHRFWRAR